MENIDFNNLEFNLYELLDIENTSTKEEIKKKFRKIVKKFHPDKISELEEKIYYNIILAHSILTNDTTRKNYDNFLDNSSKDYFGLKNCFKNENFKKYLPNDKQQANIQFHRDSEIMSQRHGTCKEDNRDFNLQFNEKKSKRNNLPNIEKEYFRNTEQFNDSFTYKKKNGQFSTQIIKYNIEDIIPYQNNKNLKFVDIKNFNKLYLEDTVEDNNCTSLNRAFLLQPVMDYEEKNITDYEKQTEELKNNSIDL